MPPRSSCWSTSLAVLHSGMLEGRKAFGNVMKYLLMGTSSNFGNMFSMAGAVLFLPFLPMLPTQILLNNFLYDSAQVTIPTDNVDESFRQQAAALGHRPHPRLHDLYRADQLDLRLPDLLRPAAVFPCSEPALSHRLVRGVAGDADAGPVCHSHSGNPLRSRPSRSLTIAVIAIVVIGMVLPYTPLGRTTGFHAAARALLSLSHCDDGDLHGAGQPGQASDHEEVRGMMAAPGQHHVS